MKTQILSLILLSSLPVFAQECTSLLGYNLSTEPLVAKGNSGDTTAAYIWFSFYGDPNLKLVIKGRYPNSRFMSFETYSGRFNKRVDSILDQDILPDKDQVNPFVEGAEMSSASRSYTVEMTQGGSRGTGNVLKLPSDRKKQAFMYRIYSPNKNATLDLSDLPHVFAYDRQTGEERKCPKMWDMPEYVSVPQLIANIVISASKKIEFKKAENFNIGSNNAIPAYLWAANQTKKGLVSVLHFKAPKYADTTPGEGPFPKVEQTRYWSMCAQNVPRNETLSCLPDFRAQQGKDGFVTLVYGGGKEVRELALAEGLNYMEDTRKPNQKVLTFFYRNVAPTKEFQTSQMHQGDFLPRGDVCSPGDFTAKECGWLEQRTGN